MNKYELTQEEMEILADLEYVKFKEEEAQLEAELFRQAYEEDEE